MISCCWYNLFVGVANEHDQPEASQLILSGVRLETKLKKEKKKQTKIPFSIVYIFVRHLDKEIVLKMSLMSLNANSIRRYHFSRLSFAYYYYYFTIGECCCVEKPVSNIITRNSISINFLRLKICIKGSSSYVEMSQISFKEIEWFCFLLKNDLHIVFEILLKFFCQFYWTQVWRSSPIISKMKFR